MTIEILQYGKPIKSVPVDLPKGKGLKLFTIRRLIIEEKVKEIKRLNPYCEIILVFESKMNCKND